MIAILMATYNGESYLREQLESLLFQTYQDFVIYISDDLSTDSTYNILQNYQKNILRRLLSSKTTAVIMERNIILCS